MIKNLLSGAAVLALLSTSALAADLPSRRAPPVYVAPPAPVFTWTGFYLGANAGYAFDNNSRYGLAANDAQAQAGLTAGNVNGFGGTRSNGFTGGGQIGYNYELGNGFGLGGLGFGGGGLVIGIEADAAYTDLRRSNDSIGANGFDTNFRSRVDYVGTVRGRIGYAFDRFLVYGTGGFAYGGVRNNVSIISAGGVTGYTGGQNKIETGYAYGGGIEYALPTASFLNFFNSSAVTIKGEFIHFDLGRSSYAVPGVVAASAGSSFTARSRTDGNLVRAGLNFKFGSPVAAPVVARY